MSFRLFVPAPRGRSLMTGLVLGGLISAGRLSAQVLTLSSALARADSTAYSIRTAAGESDARAGQALAPLRGILPSLRFEGGYVRTDNPLSAFGLTLQQRAVAQASFNPATLNAPPPTGNVGTALVLELPVLNADAWLGRRAAIRALHAASASERWSRATVANEIVQAYYGAVLASERVSTLEAGLAAARAHQRQAQSLLDHGMVTSSDALIASVRSDQVETGLLEARGEMALARQALALRMGRPQDTTWRLPDSLPELAQIRRMIDSLPADSGAAPLRADLEAARQAQLAASADLARAKSLLLPRLNAFGRLEWNTPSAPFGGARSWTVGMMLSWSPFSGAMELAEIRTARGRTETAEAQSDAAQAQAEYQRQASATHLQVAEARLSLAARGVAQSVEAHRIVSRKYDGGLATVAELEDAAALETATRLAFADARYQAIAAAAERCRATGLDLTPLTRLDP